MTGNDLKAERLWGRECSRPCAGNLSTYNMADIEPEFDIEKDLPRPANSPGFPGRLQVFHKISRSPG